MVESTNTLPDTTVPVVLSGQFKAVIESGLPHDFLVAGVPFRLDADDSDPYVRDIQEDQKDQFDNSREAGEQSFGRWWLRSQSTFHAGAGQIYLDTGQPDLTRLRFNTSSYVNPWIPGQLTLAGSLALSNSSRRRVEQVTWSGTQKLASMSSVDNKVYVHDLPGLTNEVVVTLGTSGVCQDMASDGANLFVACGDKVWMIAPGGTVTELSAVTFTGVVTLGYAKQRLVLCLGNKLYTVDTTVSVSTPPTLKYTHPSPTWTYTAVAEGPDSIYLSGFAGPNSEILGMTLTDSGGTPVLGAPIVAMRMPTGEVCNSILFYTNSQFVMATSNGIRVGTFTPYGGRPQYGSLMALGNPTYSIATSGNLVYVGGRNAVYWVDLGTPVDQTGRFAWAEYGDGINALDATDTVVDLTVFQSPGDLLFGAMNSGQLLTQTSFTPTQPGVLTTSWARFATTEPKQVAYVRVDGTFPVLPGGVNPLTVTVETDAGQTATFPIEGGATSYEFGLFSLLPAQAFRATFTLRDAGTGNGVMLRSWQIKAVPVPKRYREMVLPLMCYDHELDARGKQQGYKGFSVDRIIALEALAENNPVVTVLDKTSNTSFQAVIRRCQFVQRHNPNRQDKVGGKINLVLRMV